MPLRPDCRRAAALSTVYVVIALVPRSWGVGRQAGVACRRIVSESGARPGGERFDVLGAERLAADAPGAALDLFDDDPGALRT